MYIYIYHLQIGTITISGGGGDHQTLGHTYYIYNVYPHGHRIPISTETVVGSTHQTPVSERRLGPVPDHPAEANE